MDRWDKHRRSRGSVHRFEGNNLYKKRKGDSKFPSFAARGFEDSAKENEGIFEHKSSLAWKTDGVPIEMLIEKELTKKMDVRRPPPGVIAKLMGLDMLPTAESMRRQESGSCFPKSTAAARKSNLRLLDHPKRRAVSEQAKDIFEVSELSKYNSSNKSTSKNRFLDELKRRHSVEKDFTCENLTGATHPTDERIGNFWELNHRCEVFDSKRCLSKLDHERTSLCTENIDILSNPANLPRHMTVLKPLNFKKLEDSQAYKESESRNEQYISLGRNTEHCIYKDRSLLVTKPIARDSVPPPKFATSVLGPKQGACRTPTRIVVLKPTVEKMEKTDNVVTSIGPIGGSQMSFRKQQGRSGMCKLVSEVQKGQKVPYDVSPCRKKFQSSSELWKENKEIPRNNERDDSLDFTVSRESESSPAKSLYGNGTRSNPVDDSAACMSDHFDDRERRHEDSCYSTGSYSSREAIRHISKQWIVNKVQNSNGSFIHSSRTLGEMLAISDRENFYKKYMESRHRGNHTLGISSGNSWKNVAVGVVAGCPSRPASSCFTKTDESIELSNCDGICKNTAQSLKQGHGTFAEKNSTSLSGHSHPSFCSSDSENPTSDTEDMELISNADVDELLQNYDSGQSLGVDNICCNNIHVVTVEVASPPHGGTNSLSDSHMLNAELPSDFKDVEQTSPISVLDPPDLEARSSPDCFGRVDADLQELRLQLQFLKSESETTSTDMEEIGILSDEEGSQDGSAHPELEVPEFCTEEEERDFSYVLGILTDSGFQGVSMDKIFNACYLPETPVDPCIFEKLEKVFDEPEVWSRDERKLLFDLTNSALSEFLAPSIDLHPWVWSGKVVGRIHNRKVFAEEVWKLLARRRMKPSRKPVLPLMDADWMDVRGVINSIGRDVERMIRDELLDELISDLIC